MDRCLIVFDLDAELLKSNYHNASWNNGYSDILEIFNRHRFNNIQGTVYLSELGVRQAHGTIALQEVATRFAWFEKCVSNVRFYCVVDDFNAQFIIDGITQARAACDLRMANLRQQLIDVGLSFETVSNA
jgi:virulence-associated protein VapD